VNKLDWQVSVSGLAAAEQKPFEARLEDADLFGLVLVEVKEPKLHCVNLSSRSFKVLGPRPQVVRH